MDLLTYGMGEDPCIDTNAPANVEVFGSHFQENDGSCNNYILQLLNLSGFNGMTFSEPNRITGISVVLKDIGRPLAIFSLTNKRPVEFQMDNRNLCLHFDHLDQYEAVIVRY